jgi:DNA invertase Pin-like site-specific DNA recombinase
MTAKRQSKARTGTSTLFGRAAIYARISLDKAGEATGVGRQIDDCRHLADLEGWSIDEVLVDNDLSAYSGACRPEYERLLGLVRRREIDVIVAYHPDRLYRRLADLVELTKVVASAGVEIRTVAAGHVDLNTASGRFTAQVLGAAAEHESARIGERVSAKHRQNAERGNAHGGGRSYGYRRVAQGQIEVVPQEASVIREAAARVLAGQSLASIVVDFNERGIQSAHGKKWRPGSLGMILKSGRIAGLRESKGEVVGEANWEPILDRATWEQVSSRLTHAPIGRRPKVNLLAGMCRCAECGSAMAAVSERMDKELKPGRRPPRRTIACDKANRHGCGSNTVKADYVEQIVIDYVLAALEHTDIATARARRTGGDAHQLVASIDTDEQFLADLAADYGAQRINRAQFLAAQDPVHARLLLARRRLDQLTIDPSLDGTAFEGVTADSWDGLDLDQQRALVSLFVEHVVIRKGKRGRYFDPSRVQPVPVENGVA